MRTVMLLLAAAAMIPGVACRTNESPERQVGDAEITAQVKSKLASDIGLSSVTNISVNSTNGIVTITGQVDSADIKAKAETIVKSVPHVVRVINNLQVASSDGFRVDSQYGQQAKLLARYGLWGRPPVSGSES